jgi:hypothetical protein
LFCEGLEPSPQPLSSDGSLSGAMNMRAIIAIVLSAAALAACTPDNDVTGSIGNCARKLYSPFNPKDMKQCVGACIACERGVITTCSTSCTLKGAQ